MTRLAMDIGNTKTAIALYRGDGLLEQWRIRTEHWTADELWMILKALLSDTQVDSPSDLAFACVVPQVHHALVNMAEKRFGVHPVAVTHETAGIRVACTYPHEVGPDRLANAFGAILSGPLPAIVADFGTATTFDVIDSTGRYLGGAIAPGVGTAAGELFKKAEKLNPIDLTFPPDPLGKNTADAIRSGVLYGAVGAADHIVELLSRSVEGEPTLWATGGWAPALGTRCAHDFRICPELTLMGVNGIGMLNRKEGR